ncbi:carboxylesterase/lipase family protein [Lentzea sp. NEAU-D7]|uniref:carboxylesterase/lipase family protein n=1 Tax=Lentzea sp. NEAU-D7 TaxID=2994667 RepID=UPI00224B4DE3|nr:carboxylesterase family protein [Lentzea sp. NEAU-D7]MCX2949321.1 carboxylesterase family protein [Lentzea sp. NEAU-D7]
MRSTTTLLLAAVLVAATAVPAHAAGIVRTDTGFVSGTSTGALRSFQGIPFAAPPTGENRWRDPQPAKPWQGVLQADKPSPRCEEAEDCLYLNVTTPAKAANRPVLVWIHGGGFTTGAGADYGADHLARNGSVVVTINYRLGAFGYFGFPGLAGSGAFGLRDQQAALGWVQRNIRWFGGDPHNVTLFGASAGGLSTCAQLTSPRTRGLFHKAIIQSGPCGFGVPAGENTVQHTWVHREDVERAGAQASGCADVACLRRLTTEQVKALTPQFSSPAYGTEALPENPITALRGGRFHEVPVLAGTARDEFSVFAAMYYPPLDAAGYEQALTEGFGAAKARRILAAYPPRGGDERVALSAALSDMTSFCPTGELRGQAGAFGYEFAEPEPPMIFPGMPEFPYGAYHGSELPFLFRYGDVRLTPAQQRLSDEMAEVWSRFARTGRPGWARQDVRLLATEQVAPADHRCDLWAS